MIDEAAESAYWKAIDVMFSGVSITEGLDGLARQLDVLVPHRSWASLGTLARETSPGEFIAWLGEQLARRPKGIDLVWFSLSDMGDEITLCLMRQTRVPVDDHDWSAYEQVLTLDVPEQILRPLNDWANSAIAHPEATESTRWITETCVPLAWTGLMAGMAMNSLPIATLLGVDSVRRVASFFGEGDDFVLGEITAEGFRYFNAPSPRSA